ncbi:damage-inducible protein DinB [Bacillus sp. HMF5848]|uniref:DinB family protein n=1 Tax=Bacillus sp. HMF5848 TaxID=2495421 RepID=UPI000F7A8937|nr:DinB family protein [Bacillus sp. HMF5848]RSK27547.1 damage-inducible protein DinB [Bacillus sp. HMF5848]
MKTIRSMYKHLNWANVRILDVLRKNDNERARYVFAHLLFAEQVWLHRLQAKDTSQLPIWKEASLEECSVLVQKNNEEYKCLLEQIDTSDLDQTVTYKNSKGIEFVSSMRNILIHLALHGQYHRGQINMLLRQGNTEPINVDYINFVR